MSDSLVIGTVRAFSNGRHIVVGRDGTAMHVLFDGEDKPKIGGDVVGLLRHDADGTARMTLKRSVTDAILEGRSRIFLAGTRPDLSARLLAKVLARSKTAVIAPGSGVSIERAPTTQDPDLDWAISTFRTEADRLSVALNVIDVQAVARAPWKAASLRELTLPADTEGNGRAMHDLSQLLRSGFHPDCNRMVEHISGLREISVNFVLPYSPFAGSTGFSRGIAAMDRGHFPLPALTISDARRLSSARYVALALAHSKLGAGANGQANVDQSRRASHMANCFADAAAVLAFVSSGGDVRVAEAYADLKESSLHFGRRAGRNTLHKDVLGEATHRSIRAALQPGVLARVSTARDIVAEAVKIARRTALPASRFHAEEDAPGEMESLSAATAARRISFNLRDASHADVQRVAETYRKELRELISLQGGSELAESRLVTFGGIHVPLRLSDVFDEETRGLSRPEAVIRKQETVGGLLADRSRLARRIRAGQSPDHEAPLEFGESFAP